MRWGWGGSGVKMENWGDYSQKTEVSSWGDKDVLKLTVVMAASVNVLKTTKLHTLKSELHDM